MKENFSGVRLVIAWPLDAAHLFQPTVTHAAMHRADLAKLIPDSFGIGSSPIMTEASRQIENDCEIVANTLGRRHGATHALHTTFAGRDRAFGFEGAGRRREHNVGQFRRLS